jgi:hypothetical protein
METAGLPKYQHDIWSRLFLYQINMLSVLFIPLHQGGFLAIEFCYDSFAHGVSLVIKLNAGKTVAAGHC